MHGLECKSCSLANAASGRSQEQEYESDAGLDLIVAMDGSENCAHERRIRGLRHVECDRCAWRYGMGSRTLWVAALLFAMISAVAERAKAQENLDAGKSPSQIFAGTCTVCHKSARGLMKTVSPGALPGFLRQHYTTSSTMAGVLASYLISNGATDTRYAVGQPNPQPKGAKEGAKDATNEARTEARSAPPFDQPDHPGRRHPGTTASQETPAPHQAARPDVEGTTPQAEPGSHTGRHARQRLARPTEVPDAAKPEMDGQTPPQAAVDRAPDGRRLSAKQRLSKRGRSGEELPKNDSRTDTPREEPASVEPAKGEPAKTEAAKGDGDKVDGARPALGDKSDSATIEPPRGSDTPALRVDPVTPAPSAALSESPVAKSPSAPETTTSAVPPLPPAVAASTPPPLAAPAGPPAPPISQ
jgi:hypothetical protein